jgi:hypothetical protein
MCFSLRNIVGSDTPLEPVAPFAAVAMFIAMKRYRQALD